MARPSFPHIGWDPTPGDPTDTRALARKLGSLAGELQESLDDLGRIECGAWKGKTAHAFVEYLSTDVTPLVRKSHDSFAKASRALHRWAGQLEDFQDEADRLEREAGEALSADAEAEAKGKDRSETSGDVNKATGKVDDLERRYREAADAISRDLDKAADIAPDEPGFWDKLGSGIADAWKATSDWLEEHADLIAFIGDLLSDLTAILGTLAILTIPFEPLGAIFGAAALITSGLALVTHSVAKLAGGDVSWMSLGTDALGLLPGIGLLSKGVKVVDEAAAAGRVTRFGSGFKSTTLGAGARNYFATSEMAGHVQGGLKLFGKVALGGTFDEIGLISKGSGTMDRLAGLAEAGYHQGQWIGTKGLKLITREKLAIDPEKGLGVAIDAAGKIGTKIPALVQHTGELLHPGDRFQQAAGAR
ncbi:enoyl-CoA hydratase/isomerase family protein [Streptomyces sp. NPDC049954]|uniref:enoyl-CoA hydratase/isomerase family protein n=1 Tax=Streptomyces sp. NPDC049954 TaxID=3155779 RepID=UPI003424842F